MEKDKFEKKYFETDSDYPRAILKGRRPLQNRFWVGYIRRRKKNGRLLDVGCGKGFFLEYAERFYETYGVDVSIYALEKARRKLHTTNLCIGDATQLGLSDDYFDIISCFDIMEHLDNPELAIKECYRVLHENGLLIISVPNTDSYGLRWKKEKWYGYRDPTHVSMLSNEQWSQLLQDSGFRIETSFYNGLWDSPYFKGIPAFAQHVFFKILFTFTFPLLGTLGIKLPRKWGEGTILVSTKSGGHKS